jgi:hypothetical protein
MGVLDSLPNRIGQQVFGPWGLFDSGKEKQHAAYALYVYIYIYKHAVYALWDI